MPSSDDTLLAATTRRLTTVLFIGQGLALLAVFTTSAISSITGTTLGGLARVAGWPAATSFARIASRNKHRINELDVPEGVAR
ncbi:MAG TPA: hypothetical protein VFK30_09465 [Anaerolineae bacterium]|nr:hypothetical protein [Anaerolineae bacterium]